MILFFKTQIPASLVLNASGVLKSLPKFWRMAEPNNLLSVVRFLLSSETYTSIPDFFLLSPVFDAASRWIEINAFASRVLANSDFCLGSINISVLRVRITSMPYCCEISFIFSAIFKATFFSYNPFPLEPKSLPP